ncbi:hypothetical protein N1851_003852 [Merluccius polli]|uniref:Taste receptor type 2 n=1 Tax=Merluccius polli TaxID=89951 RepID=A0AA47P7J9_MERPO|nr:hypothetical protein N1851_003852 [Merluccius polli]
MMMSRGELNSTVDQDLMEMFAKRTYVMSKFSFVLTNGPLMFLNLMANVFFVFCLMTRKTQRVKQPLKILLGFVISSTIIYLFSVSLLYYLLMWIKSLKALLVLLAIVNYTVYVNMTSYAWLMFYYYIMIVPSQRGVFLWVKKNIKSVIYVMLFFDRLIFLGNASSEIASVTDISRFCNNGTVGLVTFPDFVKAWFFIINVYICLCLSVMMVSSFATAHYLNKHMKSLAASGGSLFNPRLGSQIRVTVTGILQGVLYCLYGLWTMVIMWWLYFQSYPLFNFNINYTVTTLFISITTVNLWFGQTLFREGAVHVWKAVKKQKPGMEMTYNRTVIDINNVAFFLVNGPLFIVNLVMNIFFAFCILTPHKKERMKQPLKILMGFLIFSAIICLFVAIVLYSISIRYHSIVVQFTFFLIVSFMVKVNMMTYVWLTFYYYIMIVPSQRALLLWVKKNIKSVIYVMLFFDRSIFLVTVFAEIFSVLPARYDNSTAVLHETRMFKIVDSVRFPYLFFSICLMMFFSFAMAQYLNKHMKSLAASGGSIFNPRLRSQIRTTVTGILQGVLYCLYGLWIIVDEVVFNFSPYHFGTSITYMVINLYFLGTTVNLSVRQTLFRERAVHVWKAVKKRFGTGKTSEDLGPAENKLTTLATIESTGVNTALSM